MLWKLYNQNCSHHRRKLNHFLTIVLLKLYEVFMRKSIVLSLLALGSIGVAGAMENFKWDDQPKGSVSLVALKELENKNAGVKASIESLQGELKKIRNFDEAKTKLDTEYQRALDEENSKKAQDVLEKYKEIIDRNKLKVGHYTAKTYNVKAKKIQEEIDKISSQNTSMGALLQSLLNECDPKGVKEKLGALQSHHNLLTQLLDTKSGLSSTGKAKDDLAKRIALINEEQDLRKKIEEMKILIAQGTENFQKEILLNRNEKEYIKFLEEKNVEYQRLLANQQKDIWEKEFQKNTILELQETLKDSKKEQPIKDSLTKHIEELNKELQSLQEANEKLRVQKEEKDQKLTGKLEEDQKQLLQLDDGSEESYKARLKEKGLEGDREIKDFIREKTEALSKEVKDAQLQEENLLNEKMSEFEKAQKSSMEKIKFIQKELLKDGLTVEDLQAKSDLLEKYLNAQAELKALLEKNAQELVKRAFDEKQALELAAHVGQKKFVPIDTSYVAGENSVLDASNFVLDASMVSNGAFSPSKNLHGKSERKLVIEEKSFLRKEAVNQSLGDALAIDEERLAVERKKSDLFLSFVKGVKEILSGKEIGLKTSEDKVKSIEELLQNKELSQYLTGTANQKIVQDPNEENLLEALLKYGESDEA